MWTLRFAGYLGGALALAATIAAALGWGTYDAATGLFQPPPINVYDLAGIAVGLVTNLVAAVAVMRGWTKPARRPKNG